MGKYKLYTPAIFLVTLMLLTTNCTSKSDSFIDTASINNDDIDININRAISLFKYLHLPTEMSTIFENTQAGFNPEITNNLENANQYFVSSEKAINMGIYGVDMAYLRLFEKNQLSQNYLSTVKTLSEYLGIPDNYFSFALENYEQNILDKDSLLNIANDIYISTDAFLRENNQETASVLIIYGGWIEALYIAFNILEEDQENTEIIANIITQKNSLESLIELMDIYKNDDQIPYFLNKLILLKKHFNNLSFIAENNLNNKIEIENYLISNSLFQEEISTQLKKIKFIVFDLRQKSVEI